MTKKVSGTPMLIAMAGLPGTGKSALAEALGNRLRAAVLNKDLVRGLLFSKEKIDYSREQDDLCMEVIYLIAEHLLERDPSKIVIIDGRTFSRSYQVEQLLSQAMSMKARPVIIECICDDAVAKERLETDLRNNAHPAGNRTYALYRSIKEKAEPITADHLVIDTGREPLEASVQRCLDYVSDQS